MIASAIREIVAAGSAPLICAAFNEGCIQIWNLETGQKTGEFSTRFAFGARSLAIDADGDFLVAGLSAKNGSITSHKVPGGEQLWIRENVEYCGYLRFSYSGKYISFTRRRRSIDRISSESGQIVETFPDTSAYVEGPAGHTLVAPVSGTDYLIRCDREIRIPRLTFAILDVAFSNSSMCITESGGPVRCIDFVTRAERWRYNPPDDSHVVKIHYNRLDGLFYGILWHYEKGQFRYLLRFDPQDGQATEICSLTSWEEAFSEATQQLVTSSGEVFALSSGETVGELAFPRIEYPDHFSVT